jgi:hypothetical protein
VKVDDIKVGERFRKDLGDVAGLAASMEEVGLLHPIVVTPKGTLIAGARRLTAARLLGWSSVPVHVVDLAGIVRGEYAENTVRKNFTLDEADEIVKALKPYEEAEAKERQQAGQKAGGRGKKKHAAKKAASKYARRSRTRAAQATGYSAATLAKVKEIKAAARAEPAIYQEFATQLKTAERGQLNKIYKAFQGRRRQHQLEVARAIITAAKRVELASVCDLRVCSCTELFASGIVTDAVITDPPYPEEFLSLFSELAKACVHVPLVAVMVGQTYLPEVLRRLCEHLAYRWTIAYLTPGGQAVQQFDVKVNAAWKPVLIFGTSREWFGDVATSKPNDNDKRFHAWGQSESGMADLVERLTKPGQLVCDPFLGGGTTAAVSLALGRRFVGCDVDAAAVKTTRLRVETMPWP